ncbi:MAG: GGDEF domain-containing protein [Geobacteraceae bacterium]|nr:GGDEF domain-containing protein [Geobacteraceae bacterium]
MLIQRLYQKLIPDNSPDRFKIMYLLLAAVCLVAILAVSVAVITWNSTADLKSTVISNSERIVDSIYYTEVDAILTSKDRHGYTITLPESAHDSLDVRIRDMYDPLNIVKLLIINRDRKIIYGNKKNTPLDKECERHIDELFSKKAIVYDLNRDRTIIDLVGEKREHVDLAEVFVPIRHSDGQIMGIFAISSDVTRLMDKSRRQMLSSVQAQTFMLLVISVISYIFIIRESSELKLAYQKLETMATTDPLTGVSNRRQLLERVEQHFALLQRTAETRAPDIGLGFIMIDVDFFKQVNDTYGHLAGDSILQEIAQVINQELRQYDVFGRYGGEEFLAVLPDTQPEESRRIAGRLISAVREHSFMWGATAIHITLSAGVTWTDASGNRLDDILSKVDSLMYEAKQLGRDQVVFRV